MELMTAIALTFCVSAVAGLALGLIVAGGVSRAAPDRDDDQAAPETQDDFTASMARWGHIRDRRRMHDLERRAD